MTAATTSTEAAKHVSLSINPKEKTQLFTPLAQQGAKALEMQKKRKAESEHDTLVGVRSTLKKWVQECLARDEKRQKLVEKGMLKCRVHAQWSDGLHQALKTMVTGYGGKLAADGEKNKGGDGSAGTSAPWLEKHNEKWLVGFDAAAFEVFIRAHPEVVEPPMVKIQTFVTEFMDKVVDLDSVKLNELYDALEAKFGPCRRPLLMRAKAMVADYIQRKAQKEASQGQKRTDSSKPLKRKASEGQPLKLASKKDEIAEKPAISMDTAGDVEWAVSLLAPLGFKADSVDPIVRSPAVVALPVLEALSKLEEAEDFRYLLKDTNVGKVINNFRHHSHAEVAKKSKALIASWRAAAAKPLTKEEKKKLKKRASAESAGGGDENEKPNVGSTTKEEEEERAAKKPRLEDGPDAEGQGAGDVVKPSVEHVLSLGTDVPATLETPSDSLENGAVKAAEKLESEGAASNVQALEEKAAEEPLGDDFLDELLEVAGDPEDSKPAEVAPTVEDGKLAEVLRPDAVPPTVASVPDDPEDSKPAEVAATVEDGKVAEVAGSDAVPPSVASEPVLTVPRWRI
uniref:TFIIS N-terminal domain-containing protein n=1 Tax=Noctiluca scintillans TaxID=2966 RepID=A0A7S1F805_NOCSC